MSAFAKLDLQSPLGQLITSKEPIAPEALEKAAALSKGKEEKALGILRRELKEIVDTKAIGAHTPKVTDELAAQLAQAPADALDGRPTNQLAAAMYFFRSPVCDSAAVYQEAHEMQAMLIGARTAMESRLVTDTEEQKAAKDVMLGLADTISSQAAIALVMSTWASFAKPAGEGKLEMPTEIAAGLPDAVESVDTAQSKMAAEAVKTVLQILSSGGVAEALAGQGKAQAEEAGEAPAKAKPNPTKDLDRDVGGLDKAAQEALVETSFNKARVGEFIFGVRKYREEWYGDLVNALRKQPSWDVLLPAVTRYLENMVAQRREMERTYRGREISDELLATSTDNQLVKMFLAAKEVNEDLGGGPLTMHRTPDATPNAYVYTPNFNKPHVVVHDSTVRMCWDTKRGDFIQVGLTAEGKAVRADDPTAVKTLDLGKYVFQGVIGHELFHIRDGIMLTRVMLGAMLGYGIDAHASDAKAAGDEACGCSMCVGVTEGSLAQAISGVLDDPSVQAKLPMVKKSNDPAVIDAALFKLLGEEIYTAGGAAMGPMAFMTNIGQEGEVLADRGSAARQGTGKYLAMFFDVMMRKSEIGSSEDAIQMLIESYNRDHVSEMQAALDRATADEVRGQVALTNGISHPPEAYRAVGNARFVESKEVHDIKDFNALPPALRLAAGAQGVDAAIERLDDTIEVKSGMRTTQTEAMRSAARIRRATLLARLYDVTAPLADLIIKDGLRLKDGKLEGLGPSVLQYLLSGGSQLFAHDEFLASQAMKDGTPRHRPSLSVNVLKQLADRIDESIDGKKLPDEERERFASFTEGVRKYADAQQKQLDTFRAQKEIDRQTKKQFREG